MGDSVLTTIQYNHYNDAEFYGRPIDIREIEIITKPYQKSPIYLKSIKRKKK